MTDPGGTLAWFHCFSGIAGDMAFGALVDAGADLDEVRDICELLPVGGWAVEAEPVLRCGIAATKVHVHAEDKELELLSECALSSSVRQIVPLLAEAQNKYRASSLAV